MIFTCPSGHKTFLGKAKEQECLPVLGASEIRHCLTCNAERRFEWKPDPIDIVGVCNFEVGERVDLSIDDIRNGKP